MTYNASQTPEQGAAAICPWEQYIIPAEIFQVSRPMKILTGGRLCIMFNLHEPEEQLTHLHMQSGIIVPVSFFPADYHERVTPEVGFNFAMQVEKRTIAANTLMISNLGDYPVQDIVIAVSRDLLPDSSAMLEAIAQDRAALAQAEHQRTISAEELAEFREALDILTTVVTEGQPAPLKRGTRELVPTVFLKQGMLIEDPALRFITAPANRLVLAIKTFALVIAAL